LKNKSCKIADGNKSALVWQAARRQKKSDKRRVGWNSKTEKARSSLQGKKAKEEGSYARQAPAVRNFLPPRSTL
jgi:hypothetical protein